MAKLTKWPKELSPLARATVLEHWGAQRGFNLSSFCSASDGQAFSLKTQSKRIDTDLVGAPLTL
jgi:hypothetical protein